MVIFAENLKPLADGFGPLLMISGLVTILAIYFAACGWLVSDRRAKMFEEFIVHFRPKGNMGWGDTVYERLVSRANEAKRYHLDVIDTQQDIVEKRRKLVNEDDASKAIDLRVQLSNLITLEQDNKNIFQECQNQWYFEYDIAKWVANSGLFKLNCVDEDKPRNWQKWAVTFQPQTELGN